MSNLQEILKKAQNEAAATAPAGADGKWINSQRMPQGRHTVRVFLDPDENLFHIWRTVWVPGFRQQADPRHFDECPEDTKSRITNALATKNYPWQQGFFRQNHMFIHVYETSVKGDKFWKAGETYVVGCKNHTRDAVIAALSEFAAKFEQELTDTLDIQKDGWGIKLTVDAKGTVALPDIMGEELASPWEDIKQVQFKPLDKLFTYNEEAAKAIVEKVEAAAAEAAAETADDEAAQTPPEEDEKEKAEAPKEEKKAKEVKKEEPQPAAEEDDDDPF